MVEILSVVDRLYTDPLNITVSPDVRDLLVAEYPSDGAEYIDEYQPELRWQPLLNASTYQVTVAEIVDGSYEVTWQDETDQTTLTGPNLPLGDYAWWFTATNELGYTGVRSEPVHFSIVPPE